MQILFLTQILPYPPNAGPRVKTWQVLQHLSQQGHQITLATFIRPEEKQYIPAVEATGIRVLGVPIRRNRIIDIVNLLISMMNGKPFLVQRDNLPAMQKEVMHLVDRNQYDVIHADQLSMAQFAWQAKEWLENNRPASPLPFLIFDAHNATWTIMDRMRSHYPVFFDPILRMEREKIKKYEDWLVTHFDHTLAVSSVDRNALLSMQPDQSISGKRVTVIPITVDTEAIQPVEPLESASQLLTVGTLHYPPNADGIRWFLREVFPLILSKYPVAELTVIGKNPPADFFEIANQFPSKISITGYVEDLTSHLKNSVLLIVPVLAGGGMRVRILEGFARALTVITTTVGLEGIEAIDGREVIVKDDPKEMAESIVYLLTHRDRARAIARAGRELVKRKYDWKVVFHTLDEVYSLAKEGKNT